MNELNDKPVPEGELKVSLTCHQRPDIKIHLMLPVKDRKLDIDMLASGWPRAYGYWEGSVWGRVEWDEENQLLLVYWSDDDLSLVDLTPKIELYKGRLFNFHSNLHKTDHELVVTEAAPL